MIVRSHLPWPVRWAVAALVFGFSAALALWAFEFGKEFAGLEPSASHEVVQLRAELEKIGQERDRAQTLANAADSLIKAEQSANAQLSLEIRKLQTDKLALEADLGFFERLLPAGGQKLQLRALQAESVTPGQLRYQMLVMQGGKGASEFVGTYDILITGTLDGRPWTTRLAGGPKPLKLRQYTRVEGLIDHPAEAVLKTAQARLLDAQGAVQATGSVNLP